MSHPVGRSTQTSQSDALQFIPSSPPISRGEADLHIREAVTVEIYNPDNDALLYRHSEAMNPSGTLLPLRIICRYVDHKLFREVVRDTDNGFATPCTGVVMVAFL